MQLFASLAHRPFALLWSGQTISRIGDSLYGIALAWWILEKTGSASVRGTVLIFAQVPMLVFLLLGGVAGDRFSRMRVMLASDTLRGVLVTLMALLILLDRLEVWHVLLASMVFGFVAAFFRPAYMAVMPEIIPSEALPSANSLTSLSGQLLGIVGPALGALMVAWGGTAGAFMLDGVSFFIAAACVVPILALSFSRPVTMRAGVLSDVREGIHTVAASPWLWITILLFGFINMAEAGPAAVSFPFLIKDNLHADVGALGVVYSLFSLGAVLGALWLGRYKRLRRRGLVGYGAVVVGGVAVAAIGLPVGLPGAGLAMFVRGVTSSFFGLIWINTLQELVPRDKLGRVSSIDDLGSFLLLPVGFALAGWATDLLGAPAVFVIGGASSALLAALALLHPAIRTLD